MREISIFRIYKEDTDESVINKINKTKIIFMDELSANNYIAVKNRSLNDLNFKYFYKPEKLEVYDNYKEALKDETIKSEEKTF